MHHIHHPIGLFSLYKVHSTVQSTSVRVPSFHVQFYPWEPLDNLPQQHTRDPPSAMVFHNAQVPKAVLFNVNRCAPHQFPALSHNKPQVLLAYVVCTKAGAQQSDQRFLKL